MSSEPTGYQVPETNWGSADVPLPSDFNRVEGNIQAIEEGSRTIDPAQAPSDNTGTLRQILDWLANRIKAITGGTNWYDAPAATLASLLSLINDHTDRTDNPHSVTAAQVDAAAADHTHDDRYYTESEADERYAAKSNPTITGALSINDANTKLLEGSGNAVKIQTDSGYVEIGPQNTTYAHIYTDRGSFYLNKDVLIKGGNKVWHAGNDGAGSGLDADTVDGLHASDFVSDIRESGHVTYTDSIADKATLTKNIALEGNYKHGRAIVTDSPTGSSPQSIIVFFGTDNLKTWVVGYVRGSSYDGYGAAWTRRGFGKVTRTGSSGVGVGATGNTAIEILDFFISETDLQITFQNTTTSEASLNCTIDWEVW